MIGCENVNAKDYLRQVEKLNTQIENKLTEKLQWQNISLGITTTTEGERVRSSGNKQKMADAINCWVDAEREIDAAIDKLVGLKAEIIRTIEQLPPTEYDVLHKRYIQGMTFDEIAGVKRKSRSWAATVHERGLHSLQKILDKQGNT